MRSTGKDRSLLVTEKCRADLPEAPDYALMRRRIVVWNLVGKLRLRTDICDEFTAECAKNLSLGLSPRAVFSRICGKTWVRPFRYEAQVKLTIFNEAHAKWDLSGTTNPFLSWDAATY